MSELLISPEDIEAALKRHISDFNPDVKAEQVGRISEVGDGIARVTGLPTAQVNELLEFSDGTVGLALNLDEETIGAVVLGSVDALEEGDVVRATGRILSVPVGLLGRVVDPLGNPIDGKGPLTNVEDRRVEIQAPGIVKRQPVREPLQTGIKAIDAMTPIGRGQRELLIGDRKTGKTTVAIDAIINQRGEGVKCIYVAIGQKGSTVAQTVATLAEYGALEFTVVVAAPASEPAPLSTSLRTRGARWDSTVSSRSCCAGRPVVRPTRVTSSTSIAACWNAQPSCRTPWEADRSLRCRS